MLGRYFKIVGILVLLFSLPVSCDIIIDDETETSGKIMFWSNFDGPPIDVYIDGTIYGTITSFFNETPSCETVGCVTVSLPSGSYEFYAVEQSNGTNQPRDWEDFFSIKANFCGTILLTP